jgi:hypothetical protein
MFMTLVLPRADIPFDVERNTDGVTEDVFRFLDTLVYRGFAIACNLNE